MNKASLIGSLKNVQSTLKYHRFNYTAQCTCSSINNTNITPTSLPNTHPAPPPSKSTICVYTAQHFSTLRQHCLRFMSAQKPTLFSESKRVLTISSTSTGTRHTTGDVILHYVKKLQFLRGSGSGGVLVFFFLLSVSYFPPTTEHRK